MASKIERGLVETSYGYTHYRATGSGPAVVLFHMNQQSSAVYLEMMQLLAPHMRVIAIDNPSHGSSDHISGQPEIADYAKCAAEVLKAIGVTEVIAVGEAVGAGVAVQIANSEPELVRKVVLLNCPMIDETVADTLAPFKDKFRPSDPTGFPALRTVEFMLETDPEHSPVNPSQDWMDRINRAQIEAGRDRWQMLTALAQFDMLENLAKIKQEVLLLTAENFYWIHRRHLALEAIKNVKSETLVGARICIGWERAAEIAPKIVEFSGT